MYRFNYNDLPALKRRSWHWFNIAAFDLTSLKPNIDPLCMTILTGVIMDNIDCYI